MTRIDVHQKIGTFLPANITKKFHLQLQISYSEIDVIVYTHLSNKTNQIIVYTC